ncbi:MAG: hypothetical protein IJW15_05385 [Clostridia bacterium]|nr:hypothetical protein [Clostridia bacterium]
MAVIIDKNASEDMLKTLENLGIKYYFSTSIDVLYSPVNTHPDMQIHFVSKQTAVVEPSTFEHYQKILPSYIKLIKGERILGGTYPLDIAYNVASLGKRIIGNLSYTDNILKKLYENLGYEFFDVKQGYTKCNLCILDKNSAITEDEGLYKSLTKIGIDVLKVPPGEVSLSGFAYGFIGGASGFITPKTLAFCGSVDSLSYSHAIKKFLKSKNIEFVSLSNDALCDLGSIVYFEDFPF